MKTTTLYDFTLTANGSFVILADADFYKVLTSTGDISVTRDGGATIKPLRAGRGERNVPFQRLVLKDLSGAPNSGTILVGDSDFIDDTIVLSSAINSRPEAPSNNWKDTSILAANTPLTVFTPASNTGGVILLGAWAADMAAAASSPIQAFLAKNAAPANIGDGEIVAGGNYFVGSTYGGSNINLAIPQYIAAGLGLYFISTGAGGGNYRAARWKNL